MRALMPNWCPLNQGEIIDRAQQPHEDSAVPCLWEVLWMA